MESKGNDEEDWTRLWKNQNVFTLSEVKLLLEGIFCRFERISGASFQQLLEKINSVNLKHLHSTESIQNPNSAIPLRQTYTLTPLNSPDPSKSFKSPSEVLELIQKLDSSNIKNSKLLEEIIVLTSASQCKDEVILNLKAEATNLSNKIVSQENQLELQRSKLEKINKSYEGLLKNMRNSDVDKESIVAKYEGKIELLEDDFKESEKKCASQENKIRVLVSQIEEIKQEYENLTGDYNTCMELLNEQVDTRESYAKKENDFSSQINKLNQLHKEEMQEKEFEIENLKKELAVDKIDKDFSEMEKKYKSLERLYVQQIDDNGELRSKIQELESAPQKHFPMVIPNFELISELDIYFPNEFLQGLSQQYRTRILNLFAEKSRFEKALVATQSENEDLKLKNQENESNIIALYKKVLDLKEKLKQTHVSNNEILEFSDNLGTQDYDLTKSLELKDIQIEDNILVDYEESPLSDLANLIAENKLINTEKLDEISQVKAVVETLNYIKLLLVSENIMTQDESTIFEKLEEFVEKSQKELEKARTKSKKIDFKKKKLEYFVNNTEPSPQTTRYQNHISDYKFIDEKLQAKKRQITMHKEQIQCLKKQLRGAECLLKASEVLDIGILKSEIKSLFERLPRLGDSVENSMEICMSILGFAPDEQQSIKNRLKTTRIRLNIFN